MKKILFIISFSSYTLFVCAQNTTKEAPELIGDQLFFYLLDVEQGLSNNTITSIEQDSLGFIWVGTEDGLNRYDGTKFQVYKRDNPLGTSSINNNLITHLNLDPEGQLLITTAEELNVYNPKTEQFKTLNQADGLISNNVSCIIHGPKDELILGINFDGLQILDGTSKKQVFTHNPNSNTSLSSNEIFCLTRQGDSVIWIGTANNGLNKLNYKTKTITRVPYGPNQKISSSKINALYTDTDGNVWIGTRNGVQVITTKKDTLSLNKSLLKGKGLSNDNVLCFEEDNKGRLWIGTRNGGLNIINRNDFLKHKKAFEVKWYNEEKNDGSSVFNRTVSALKKDNWGGMWIGTSLGLNYVNPDGEPIKVLHKSFENSNSLGHNRISALAENPDHKIWIGTDGAGLDLYDPITGNFKYYQSKIDDPYSISNDYVLSLCVDSKQRLWAGTYQGGLNKLNSITGGFSHYLQGDVDNGSDVRVIFEDSNEHLWVGTNRGGLYRYNETLDYFDYIDSLGKLDIRDIDEDKEGYLWLATYGDGIIRYDTSDNQTVHYNTSNSKGFTSNRIFSLLILSNGDILAGTFHEGLLRLNPKDKTTLSFTETNGLSNNTVTSILKEDDNNIWLGTFKGISHFDETTNKIYNLNTFNNIQKGEFNGGTTLKSSLGTIYMGGNYGLNIFNPKNLLNKKEKYPIVFEKLEVLGKSALISNADKEGIQDTPILNVDHIQLKHDEAFLSIEYVALKYPFVKDTKYSYRVDNYIDRWIYTDKTGRVDLTNVPHGDYTLYVKAEFGSGDEVTKALHFTISPPFWQTIWAYLIYIILATIILWASMKFYSERIKLMNSLLFEKKQRQLEHDFNEERIRFFTSFSHELKTPLTLILAPLEDLIAEIKSLKHKKSLKLIYTNANLLLQRVNRLLEFRKSNLGLSELKVNNYNITHFLEQWIDNYYPLAKKRDIVLTYDFPETPLCAWVDLEKLHIVFNNLLSNAFKYMEDKGKILVALSYDEDIFEIKVMDTGYGIAPNELEHIFERYYRTDSAKNTEGIGIGLALSKNLVELHMGTIQIESEVHKGSVFTIVIPRDKNLFENALIADIEKNDSDASQELEEWVIAPGLSNTERKLPNIDTKDNKELILLVDDNPDILNYMEGLLESHYDLIFANNGEEGLEKALRYIPDLIVSDVMMPKMNGMELCNRIKKTTETTHIPIILLTAKGNIESIQEGYTYGADDYIIKPFNSQIFQTRIRNLLDTRKQLRSYFIQKGEINTKLIDENSSLLEKEKDFLKLLEQVILEQLDQEKIDVGMVTKEIAMSRTSLFRKVKAITGMNINQFITKVKIDKAAALLKTGDYTVAQASYEVGFNNVKYFRKLFKEQFEQLPSELSQIKNK